MTAPASPRSGALRIFAVPSLLAATSIAGLLAGLNGDGLFDLLAWLGLGMPLLTVAIAWRRRRT